MRAKLSSQQGATMMNPFPGPDVMNKLRNNPKTKSMMNDPSYLQLQTNPNSMATKLGDPRVLTTLSVLLGVDVEAVAADEGEEGPMEIEPSSPVDPKEEQKDRFIKAYENYSFEELRFVSPTLRRASETMLVRANGDGSYSANWTPSGAGVFRVFPISLFKQVESTIHYC